MGILKDAIENRKMASKLLSVRGPLTAAARQMSGHGPRGHAPPGGMKKWKLASILGGIPCFAVVWINTYLKEQEHHAHFERPEFVPYEHLRIRTKAFFFGDGKRSMFHTPHVNALPDGYEDEERSVTLI